MPLRGDFPDGFEIPVDHRLSLPSNIGGLEDKEPILEVSEIPCAIFFVPRDAVYPCSRSEPGILKGQRFWSCWLITTSP
jgi:hypothetical protein